MSLFRLRDWWSTTCGDGNGEEYDQGCLCTANVDNALDNLDKIIVGSYAGVLRVFSPKGVGSSDATDTTIGNVDNDEKLNVDPPPKADSLLLEAQLSAPILQVTVGRFVSSSRKIYLTVLHPRKLSVYGITAVEGQEVIVDVGVHYQLGFIYEHHLQRSAYRMIVGPFGGVDGRDFTCVLSLDGTLSFFEQESFVFSRFLPGAILPGPLAYVPHPMDAFVTASSAYLLEVYKYQVLAVASSSDDTKDNGQNVKLGKKLTMNWFYNLGEIAIDISVVNPIQSCSSLIYVLGERHLFCLSDTGALKFMKKFEFSPSCFHVYIHGAVQCAVFVLIASHSSKMLMVYQDFTLKWACQLDVTPIAIRRIDLPSIKGAIVSLSDDGHLNCCYLGTNPSIFTPPALGSYREIDYKETDRELLELQRIINASQKTGTLITRQTEPSLVINVIVPKEITLISSSNWETGEQTTPSNIDLKVELRPILPVEDVQVTCHFENSFSFSPSHLHFKTLADNVTSSFTVQLIDGFVPSTLKGTIVAVYTGVHGGSSPMIAKAVIEMPLTLIMSSCQPQKDADFKITIGVRTSIFKLDDLFPEFVDPNSKNTIGGQAMGFQYHYNGPIVTILVAKSTQRYRLQSDTFGAMGLVADELQSRLEKGFSLNKSLKNENDHRQPICVYSNPLPLPELFFVVNTHLQIRHKLSHFEKNLSQLAAQFRAIQKRLLTKFKDKTTTPVANLDTLLESTNRQMMTTSLETDECRRKLQKCLCLVNGSTNLLCLLLKLYANLNDHDYNLIQRALCPLVINENEQGWEEIITNNVNYLLETKFKNNRSKKEMNLSKFVQLTIMPDDINVVRSSVTRLVETLGRGVGVGIEEEQPKDATLVIGETISKANDHGLPVGSIFGQKVKAVRFFRPSSSSNQQIEHNENLSGIQTVPYEADNQSLNDEF